VRQRQVNIRFDDETYERLEIAAFIDRQSVPDAMRVAILVWLDGFDDADIEAGQRLRKTLVAKEEKSASVTSLAGKRRVRNRSE
jgi:hypothetical protein